MFIGQERFRSMTKNYFRRSDGVILVYDTTNERSYLNVRHWMDSIEVKYTIYTKLYLEKFQEAIQTIIIYILTYYVHHQRTGNYCNLLLKIFLNKRR